MKKNKHIGLTAAGFAAGAVNGLFGAGGGIVLVPLLTLLTDLPEKEIFPTSISIILPICLVSLAVTAFSVTIPWSNTRFYLLGSTMGGILAGCFGKRIPTVWLHKALGIMILWGGIRYLC